MLEVVEVKTKRQQRDFLNFPLKMYKGNEYFVPPLYIDEKGIFKKNFVYNDQCDTVYYNAYRDGVMVGRISGILQRASNEKWQQKRVRFTRFDAIDDQEVANVLFKAVEDWARSKGMEEVVGPLGFSDLEREGLLIDGFDQLSTFEEQYNFPYYQKLIENLGYEKEVDWVERKLRKPKVLDERIPTISQKMLERYKLHIPKCKNINDFVKRYGNAFFEILDETYEDIYGTVPFTPNMKKLMISEFKLLINLKYVAVIVDENDKVVCFGLSIPSLAKAVQKSGGHLTIPTIIKILKAKYHPEIVDLALIGVIPEYAHKGVSTALIWAVMQMFDHGVKFFETNLNLEDNLNIQNQWKMFDAELHKRRRSFVKKIV